MPTKYRYLFYNLIFFFLQACGDSKSKPSFLSDKNLEPSIKQIIRKFPNADAKSLSVSISSLIS